MKITKDKVIHSTKQYLFISYAAHEGAFMMFYTLLIALWTN